MGACRPMLVYIAMALGLFAHTPAYAHHEAIVGPQSSAVLSAGSFASAQVFTRESGSNEDRRRLTTAVFSEMHPFSGPFQLLLSSLSPLSHQRRPGGIRAPEDCLGCERAFADLRVAIVAGDAALGSGRAAAVQARRRERF